METFCTHTVSMAARRIRRTTVACVTAAACLWALVPMAAGAAPTNAKIRSLKEQAAEANSRLDAISAKLELANEDYQEALETVQGTKAKLLEANNRLREAQAQYDAAQLKLNDRAAAIYKEQNVSFVDVVLGSDNFSDMVTRIELMQRISDQDSALLVEIRSSKAAITLARNDLKSQEAKQTKAMIEVRQKKSRTEGLLAEQQNYLNSINSQVKKEIAAEEKRQEEAARRAAAAARAHASGGGSGSAGTFGSVSGGRTFTGNLGSSHPGAVAIARKFVGKTPYVWGGTTPSGFDCSGLTQYCYRQIGISIPRTSREQYRIGSFIPANRTDLLQAGDLLFFGYNRNPNLIHHVAMYVGGGMFVQAPRTGLRVNYGYLSGRSDYVGAVRP